MSDALVQVEGRKTRRFVLDVRPTALQELTIRTPSGEKTLAVAALVAAPIAGTAPDGSTFRLSAALRDGAIDLVHGLGTRDFTGEWDDADAPLGRS